MNPTDRTAGRHTSPPARGSVAPMKSWLAGSATAAPGSAGSRAIRIVIHAARLVAGPLVLAGFFLPWAEGPGILAATEFTGFKLVSFTGRLEQLDLSLLQSGGLWLVRLILLGVVVAAVWHSLLAAVHRRHRFYGLSGWYLVTVMTLALGLGLARYGLVLPPAGLALCGGGALLFALCELGEFVRQRPHPGPSPLPSGNGEGDH